MLQLNLKNRAITQTTESFNSMCMLGNVPIGATGTGLYRMCGSSDNGVEIPALMRSGVFDLGTEKPKRFRFFYLCLETDGELTLTVFCDGEQAAQYSVSKTTGIQEIKVPISRAHQGVHWQWQVENVDGAFFALYSVKALPVVLHR